MIYISDLVSIITPNYNSGKFLEQTIEQVFSQTYTNWEMIIVDDCSTDRSYEIAQQYGENDLRFKFIRMEKNSGAAICRNKAIELAKGEYIAFLDSDDVWLPEKLEKQIRFMKAKDCDFSFSEYEHIDENGKSLGVKAKVINRLTYWKLMLHTFTGCLTVMYNQQRIGKIYGPNVKRNEDKALFLKVLKKTKKACGIKEVLALYRISGNSASRKKIKLIKPYIEILHKHEGLNYLLSWIFLCFHTVWKMFFKYKKVKIKFGK